MAEVFQLIGAVEQLATAHRLAGLCPPDDEHIAGLWIGFAMGGGDKPKPRLRLYANNGWGEVEQRWLRLVDALRALNAGGFAARLHPLLDILVPTFSPAGLALTVPSSPPLCKLYLRPLAPPWASVRDFARILLADHAPRFVAAIEDALEHSLETIPERALVVSMAGTATGNELDLKIDLCGHCLFADDLRPARVIERLASALGLVSSYAEIVADFGCGGPNLPKDSVAFIGVGANASGHCRINVYLTAPPRAGR